MKVFANQLDLYKKWTTIDNYHDLLSLLVFDAPSRLFKLMRIGFVSKLLAQAITVRPALSGPIDEAILEADGEYESSKVFQLVRDEAWKDLENKEGILNRPFQDLYAAPTWLCTNALTTPNLINFCINVINHRQTLAEAGIKIPTMPEFNKIACSVIHDIFDSYVYDCIISDESFDALCEYNDCMPIKFARNMYDSDKFEYMQHLGQSLYLAGVRDKMILEHCEKPCHIPGCWLLDKVLQMRKNKVITHPH